MEKTLYMILNGYESGREKEGQIKKKGISDLEKIAATLSLDLNGRDSIQIFHSSEEKIVDSARRVAAALSPIEVELIQRDYLDDGPGSYNKVLAEMQGAAIIVGRKVEIRAYYRRYTGKILRTVPVQHFLKLKFGPGGILPKSEFDPEKDRKQRRKTYRQIDRIRRNNYRRR